jgi:amino acid transporter
VADASQGESGYERLGAKRLSLIDVVAQSVGFMGPVFSAAFLIPLIAGAGASGRGAGEATPFAVILASIGVFALGWIVAQYAKKIHAAGSLYDYVSMGFGGRTGAVAGWVYYGGTTVLASAIVCLIGGLIHDILLGEFEIEPLPGWVWSLLFVAAVFLIMYLGVEISTRVQLTLALVSAAVVLVFFLYVILQADTQKIAAFSPTSAADGWGGILFGVVYGVLIFVGFETAANLAEETAEPQRSIPRAVTASVVLVAVFYVVAAYAQLAGFSFDIATFTSPDVANAGPIFILASPSAAANPFGFGSTWILRLIELVVILDIAAVGLGAAVASTRGLFALARDRRIPGPIAAVSSRRGTPAGAIAFVEAVSLVMLFLAYNANGLFALLAPLHYFAMFIWLSTFGGFALVVVYLAMSLGAFKGLADNPNRAGVIVASLVGVLLTAGAVFGGVWRVEGPLKLVPYAVLVWLVLGVVVTFLATGREPASRVLSDLRSDGEVQV